LANTETFQSQIATPDANKNTAYEKIGQTKGREKPQRKSHV